MPALVRQHAMSLVKLLHKAKEKPTSPNFTPLSPPANASTATSTSASGGALPSDAISPISLTSRGANPDADADMLMETEGRSFSRLVDRTAEPCSAVQPHLPFPVDMTLTDRRVLLCDCLL